MLNRVIECFSAQTYQNKEMIILYEEGDVSTEEFVKGAGHLMKSVRFFKMPAEPGRSLGALRNEGINLANGEFICQWDDDDWYHMNRLTCQHYALFQAGRAGSLLTRWLVFDAINKRAYVSNRRLWEGSIMGKKSLMQQRAYENVSRGEDTAVIDYMAASGCLHFMDDVPEIYIYVYHGGNTWDQAHWHHIFRSSTALADRTSNGINDILNREYTVETASLILNELMEKEEFK